MSSKSDLSHRGKQSWIARMWGMMAFCLLASVQMAAAEPPFVHTQTFRGAPEREDGTGKSIALTESHILVASPDTKALGVRFIARIYDADSFAPVANIMSPEFPFRGGGLGRVTEMLGNHALICGEGWSHSPPSENLALLHDVATGERLLRFEDPSGAKGSRFAGKCALSKRHALIAAPGYGAERNRSGSAYLFDVNTGELLHEFNPPIPKKGGGFGMSIALSDRYAAIVQGNRTSEIVGPGAVYVYDLESGHLARTFEQHEDDRGYVGDLALQGDHVLIGHTYGRVDGRKSGRIDIFDIKTRKHVRRIVPPGLPKNAFFGGNVVWSGDLILAGIIDLTAGGKGSEGVAMLFDATTGEHLQTFARPPGEERGIFPIRIAMAGDRILLSGLDDEVIFGGDAYLYERRAK